MVLRARLQFFAHRKETLAVHLSPVPNLNGVWGAMEQKVHLSPVPVLKPACCLDSSIKRPFYETALTNIRKDRKHPKSGSINSFRQSEFSNQQSHTSKANSNSCLRWFLVPLLPKPLLQLGLTRSGGKRLARPGGLGRRGLVSVHILFSSGERRGEAAALGWVVGLGPFNSPCEGQKVGGLH
jgi:hypothetical protein